ncbi:hypothetical protein NYE71_32195 [Bacillus sp. FSL K6-0273]|uniref:hypothetical protein n=1 Tax=Bacillus TaxID=1386 RepID=UPI000BEBFBA1|nr:hypothetical protein [Bacillus thuringiensis]PDZ92518.1 hypothetical protein CON47_06035 [Bacillus thuringiensis]
MAEYRKRPVVIEAFRYGIQNFPDWFQCKVTAKEIKLFATQRIINGEPDMWCEIPTLEGRMKGSYGDYIIKGVNGEIYPCKADIFEKTYEAADDVASMVSKEMAQLARVRSY